MEKRPRAKLRKNKKNLNSGLGKVGLAILVTVGVAGFLTMAVVAPNALQALAIFDKKRKYNRGYYINNAVGRLKSRGFVEFIKKDDKTFLCLTEKGKEELKKYQLKEKFIKRPKKWDGKWRAIIFDIKEVRRGMRNALRRELTNLGFIKLQNSVWVCPYECEEIVIMLKAHFKIGKDALYMTVDKIENDKWIRKIFDIA